MRRAGSPPLACRTGVLKYTFVIPSLLDFFPKVKREKSASLGHMLREGELLPLFWEIT